MEKVSVPLEVLVDRAEDAQIRAEMSKRIIAEWMDCPEHTDTAHSVNTYPFANILRESLWSRILHFLRRFNWSMMGALLFSAGVDIAAVWAIYHAIVGR